MDEDLGGDVGQGAVEGVEEAILADLVRDDRETEVGDLEITVFID